MPAGNRIAWVVVGALAAALACGGHRADPSAPAPAPAPDPAPSPAPAPVPPPVQMSAVAAENQQPGGAGWKLHERAAPGVLEGYAGAASVQHGEAFDVHVASSRTAEVRWEAWRMGWYGGAGGRRLATGGPFTAGPQPLPAPDPTTGLIACRWPVSFRVQTDRSWTSGVYLLVLEREDGPQSWIPFVVRADERKGVGVFQASFTTYQAYNPWGGKSLYGEAPGVEVSFDRPYGEGNGAGHYFRYESDFVRWAESRGLDLTYLTNLDVDRDPSLLLGQKIFLSVGHDEYWSRREREGVEAALAAGTSLAFFSANSAYWQIRLEPSRDDGRPQRTQVCWKKRSAEGDPLRGTPLETTKWRLPPVDQPENALIGVMYTAWERAPAAAWIVQSANAWPYEGTGVKDGDAIPGIVGYETDSLVDNGETPDGIVQLAHSPIVDVSGRTGFQDAVVRDLPNGAFVFAAGTIEWSWGLANDGLADARVQRVTENVLRRAGLASDATPRP